jgi:hypothetical protein
MQYYWEKKKEKLEKVFEKWNFSLKSKKEIGLEVAKLLMLF